jgi:predicted nuclease with TOPRIM domain
MKTVEELQAELDKQNEKIEALANKNAEILDEKKKLEKKYKEIDTDEYFKLRDEHDALQNEYKKLEKDNAKLSKDNESLSNTVTEKEGSLRTLLVDDGIAKALNGLDRHKLNDGALELATLAIKSKGVDLVDGVAMVGDKPLNEYIANDFVNEPSARNLITPNENSGGGAGGGDGGGGNSLKKGSMSLSEKGAYIKEHGNDAYLALPN